MKQVFIPLFFCTVCFFQNCTPQSTSKTEDLDFIEFKEDSVVLCISVKASINNSVAADFILDTGASQMIEIDSAYFFDNVYTKDMVYEKPEVNMYFWEGYYNGVFNISIGNHHFVSTKARVVNLKTISRASDAKGIIGENAFLNKTVVVDYDRMQIAFSDTCFTDGSYCAVTLYPPRIIDETELRGFDGNRNQRFVKVDGFKTKKGGKKSGYFLLDLGNCTTALYMKKSFAETLNFDKNKIQLLKEVKNPAYKTLIDSVTIGNLGLLQIPIRYSNGMPWDFLDLLDGGDGLLGIPLLRRLNFIIDYKNNVFYFKPNRSFLKEKMYINKL